MTNFTKQQECLLRLSERIWARLGAAKRTGLNFSEETATELLLLDLAAEYPGRAAIIPFSRHQEAQVGADWAWAFVGPDGVTCQGMLVQAKRLYDDDKDYRSLYYWGKTAAASQLDTLIANARSLNLPPVFAFYNHLDDTTRVPQSACGTLGMMGSSRPESWGVALASAFEVRAAKPDKNFDRHKENCRPLHCLLCSRGSGQQDAKGSAGAAATVLSELFQVPISGGSLVADSLPPIGARKGLPEIFRRAEEAREAGTEDVEGVLDGIRREFPEIAGVVILRDIKEG